ncbi:MAG: alpha/beta fold hydrolase [Bacillota bacterium]|nr:alpha/beta fold hydrolase [Bacillota bacterium]
MKIGIIIACIVAAIILAAIFIGNYFVNFGLARRKELSRHIKAEIPDHLLDEERFMERAEDAAALNHMQALLDVDKWKRSISMEKVSVLSRDDLRLIGNLYGRGITPEGETVSKSVSEGETMPEGRLLNGTDSGRSGQPTKGPIDDFSGDTSGRRWVILIHGYQGKKEEMEPFAMEYCKRGYRALCIDLRSHGESQGKFVGMGYLDGQDMRCWMEEIIRRDPDAAIVLHGHSMGGSTVVTACGMEPPASLKAAVADCPFSSTLGMFKKQLKAWFGLPAFPVLHLARLMFRLRGGYPLKEAEAGRFACKIRTPILYIHGSEDKFVPTEMSRRMYEDTQAPKELCIIEGAAHVQSQDTDPERYYRTVFDFLERYV